MTHWVMIIDTRHCIGCKACIYACSQANKIADSTWRKIREYKTPQIPQRQRHFLTRSCMHCSEPPCLNVCPTTATYRRDDGIVAIDHDKCIGCSACILACPYDARALFTARHDFETGEYQIGKREGTCSKCHFCLPRLNKGIEKGLNPGIDDDATPLCVSTCSTGALNFGDLDDLESNVSKLIKNNKTIVLSEKSKTSPSVYYIIG